MGAIDQSDELPRSWEEQLAQQFYTWELRGRGWQLWDQPVEVEPPFAPFFGYHRDSDIAPQDDGRKHTLVSGLVDWLHRKWVGEGNTNTAAFTEEPEDDPEPKLWTHDEEPVELQISVPRSFQVSREAAEQFLLSLNTCVRAPAFEIIGIPDRVFLQIACSARDAGHVQQQIEAHFPEATVARRELFLAQHWHQADGADGVVAELGLAREFVLPLASPSRNFSVDPLTTIVAVLADVAASEVALLQILFQPVRHPWAESVLRSVMFADGTPLFSGVRDYVKQARLKVSRPLYGAIVRIAARSAEEGRALELAHRLVGAMAPLNSTEGNELMPLDNDGYDADQHAEDLLQRRSRRGGTLLNSEELVSVVHLPSASVQVAKLRGSMRKTKPVPLLLLNGQSVLGLNEHAGEVRTVSLAPEQRARHMHVVGASGTGKSTMLLNLIAQDIRNGDGFAVLDPHGDLIDDVIALIPRERAGDVVLFDPADEEWPVGFNILSAHSSIEKNLLASDLVAVFRRLSTSWGDQMNAVLANGILAFLESSGGGTLFQLRRFLVERDYRREFLKTVQDPEIVYYWTKEFPMLTGRPHGPVLTRLDTFLRQKSIRYMVAQRGSRLDFANMMDGGKIFLARLSHGVIGEENAHLLGTLLVSKFHQLALSRQRMRESDRRFFWLYVDEFHNFATPSMAAILSGARKYRLGLVLAHQEMRQVERATPDVASAVLANAFTRVCFRLGDEDARKLAAGFSSFDANDLQNLGTGEAICRAERADLDFNLRTVPVEPTDERIAAETRRLIVANTRQRYAVPRHEVETELAREHEDTRKNDRNAEVSARAVKPEPMRDGVVVPPPPVVVEEPEPISSPHRPTKEAAESVIITDSSKAKVKRDRIPAEDAELGRGGPAHKYVQQLIKQCGENLGYRGVIEKPMLGGKGSVDVVLSKAGRSIACQVAVSTSDEWELNNLQKCLKEKFDYIAVVCPDAKRLAKLQSRIEETIPADERKCVRYFSPDQVIAFLQDLEVNSLQNEERVRGYKVKTKYRALDAQESDDRRQAISSVVAASMKRRGKSKPPN